MKKLNKGIFASVLMGAALMLGACNSGVDHDKDYSVYSEGISTASTVDDTAVCSGYSAKNIVIVNDNKNLIEKVLVTGKQGVSTDEYDTLLNKLIESVDKNDMVINTTDDELLVEFWMEVKSSISDLSESTAFYAEEGSVDGDKLDIELYALDEYFKKAVLKITDAKCN